MVRAINSLFNWLQAQACERLLQYSYIWDHTGKTEAASTTEISRKSSQRIVRCVASCYDSLEESHKGQFGTLAWFVILQLPVTG